MDTTSISSLLSATTAWVSALFWDTIYEPSTLWTALAALGTSLALAFAIFRDTVRAW